MKKIFTLGRLSTTVLEMRDSLFASKINGNFKFKIGAKAAMGIGDEFEETNFFLYPELALSYRPQKGNFAPFKFDRNFAAK